MSAVSYSEAIPTGPGYYVYRLWAPDETCLYVGRVGDSGPRPPQPRLNNHRRQKAWWPDVARIEFAELPDHPAVVAEETRQIWELRPIYNTRYGCTHDLSLPGMVMPSSGKCRECGREYNRNYTPKTPNHVIRVEGTLWSDYTAACEAEGITRSDDLRAHMLRKVKAWKRRMAAETPSRPDGA